jgi:hypothetical protein
MSTNAAIPAQRAPIVLANDNHGGTAFIIETGDIAAGVVVREAKTFRFFAAHGDFRALDGAHFTTPAAAQKAADLVHASGRDAIARQRAAAERRGAGQ